MPKEGCGFKSHRGHHFPGTEEVPNMSRWRNHWQTRQTQTLVFKGSTPFLGTINKSVQQNVAVKTRRGTAAPYADSTVKAVCAVDLFHIGVLPSGKARDFDSRITGSTPVTPTKNPKEGSDVYVASQNCCSLE